ncbi:hypothetical protein RhoFasB10_00925 [Rhodococcus sp. B10]|nr:hypothetical protein [Rhodococcus sp. B10]
MPTPFHSALLYLWVVPSKHPGFSAFTSVIQNTYIGRALSTSRHDQSPKNTQSNEGIWTMTTTQAAPTGTAPATTTKTSPKPVSDSALVSSDGRTTIADTVVSKIAGIATREVQGVHDVGGGAVRAIGALRERIPGARVNQSQGVSVEVGERQAAVDIDIVAEYGVSIADLAAGIRRNVITAVERMTGLEVTEVNITVHDVFLDDGSDDTDEAATVRVQ